jgi:hypothetical protein
MKYAIISAISVGAVSAYSSSLDDCKSFAALFNGSCGGTEHVVNSDGEVVQSFRYTAADWATSSTGTSFTCTPKNLLFQTMNCPNDSVESKSCVLSKVNCLTCFRDDANNDSQVYLTVQTNGIPDHCYGTTTAMGNPITHQVDFTVKWNLDVLTNDYLYNTANSGTTALLTGVQCDPLTTAPSNIPTERGYTANTNFLNSASIDGVVGFAIDNTFIYRAVNADGKDGLNPADNSYTTHDITDLCGHQIVDDSVVYRSVATCMT